MLYFRFLHIVSLVLLFCSTSVFSQNSVLVNKLDSYMEKVPKPIVFFFHTDWCNYCAMQKKQLKNDDFLKNMLNEQFYFVDFNAESEDIVHFNGDSYDNVKQNKYAVHSLTRHFFTDNSPIGYPAWVITDKNYNVIFKYQGLLKPEKLKEIFALAIKQ